MHRSYSYSTINQALKNSYHLLDSFDRFKVKVLILIQFLLSLLDLLGVALIGILGALAVNGVASRQPESRVYKALQIIGLESESLQVQAAVIAFLATSLLLGKTFISVFLTRRTAFYLSRKAAVISGILLSKLLNQSLIYLNSHSNQKKLYSISSGVSTIVVGILSTVISLFSDFSLLIILLIGLFAVDFVIATSALIIFSSIGLILYLLMNKRASELGKMQTSLSINYNQEILEALGTYRESYVHNRRAYYSEKLAKDRLAIADLIAEFSLMPNVSKYVLETAVILSAIVISGIQFSLHDAPHAVAILSVFLAASTRISPAVLRIQQGLISIKNAVGGSAPTFEIIEHLKLAESLPPHIESLNWQYTGFRASVLVKDLTLKYPNSLKPAISQLSFDVLPGQSIAIVGASGAGKTSLVDTILGIHIPDSGHVKISGLEPLEAIKTWPGAISYVPQDILIVDGTIKENVALGYPINLVKDEDVWEAIKNSQLSEFVKSLPNQLESSVGDRGAKLSGGQRQRLGIARALFTKPKLLILDEATSALDGKTELAIAQAVNAMRGQVTVITIAHRLSTVRNSDKVLYLENGKLVAIGNFSEVRKAVPDFDEQAKLMGL